MTLKRNEPRSEPRSNVFLMAALSCRTSSRPVRVRNLSAQGALLEGSDLPSEGERAMLRRGTLSVSGEIAWRKDKTCGMRFELPVQVSSWVKRTGSEPQQRVDAFVTKLRRGDSELGRMGHRNIAAQSDKMIAKKLIEICERIAAMPHLSTELAEELIRIEALATFLDRR